MITKLPAYAVNDEGAMKEWIHPELHDYYLHRHLSHLYPLFPGFEITRETDPAIFEACRVAVEKRQQIGQDARSGWSLAHAAMMMIPEPWSKNKNMDRSKRDFYEFNSCLMEPWDGPAAIVFTDGTTLGGCLIETGFVRRVTMY